MQTGTAIVVLDVVYALCPAVVLAHDDANWIARNPNYTAPTGRHCCGPGDCYRIFADLVYEDGDGITFLPTQQKFRRGTKGTYLSETMTGGCANSGSCRRFRTRQPFASSIPSTVSSA